MTANTSNSKESVNMDTKPQYRKATFTKSVDPEQGSYEGEGVSIRREYVDPETDIDYSGQWVLRIDGKAVDSDRHRFDVAERHHIDLDYPEK